jgi:uncharacterized protein YndB with AHSA1/START domain
MIGGGPLAELNVRRWYPASRDLVFRAFTEPDLLERWFCPSPDVHLRVLELDLRIGGRYRFLFTFPDDRPKAVIGAYRVIDRPGRLTFTWTWEPPDPHAGQETIVTVDLVDKDGGTELTLSHVNFPSDPLMQQHKNGWAGTLDRLGATLPAL